MNTQNSVNRSKPVSSLQDSNEFDLEDYRARVSGYIDESKTENRIFFDALQFSHALHDGQKRRSGAPYISHPCAVAEILIRELQIRDPVLLAGALLHDVVEDVPSVKIHDIQRQFGEVVAELVDGCTKLTRYYLDKATLNDRTHRKIFLSASRRLGVLIIKLADRLHNLRTLHYLPKSKRQRIAQETVEVYAPIAAKLNIFPLKRELYHRALSFLYPRKSKKVLNFIRDFRQSPEVMESEATLRQTFSNVPYSVTIRPRSKGLGSYYDPLRRILEIGNSENHLDFTIILGSENIVDCYTALGIVNSTFSPIPKTLRDFIANPKNNGYRSLHVRVHIGAYNYLIKIRTSEMDKWAAYGVLTDWDPYQPLSEEYWQEISDLLRDIGEYGGAAPRRKALIQLSETEEIFAYTPRGDIHYLPKGSIVLDFAYKIHSELGNHCEGALINNQWTPPTHVLSDGDTVRVLTSTELLDVDPDLEDLCKTPKARTAINRLIQEKRQQYASEVGREIMFQEILKQGLSLKILQEEKTKLILEVLNQKDLLELYTHIGQDQCSPRAFLFYFLGDSLLRQTQNRNHIRENLEAPQEKNILFVSEIDKTIHKFARCCKPYPGQEQLVAVLSERGVTFHRENCQNLLQPDLHPDRLLKVKWKKDVNWPFPLVFHLIILQETPLSLFSSLAKLSSDIQIEKMESAKNKLLIKLTTVLRNFQEAENLFQNLPSKRTLIKSYNRQPEFKEISEKKSLIRAQKITP